MTINYRPDGSVDRDAVPCAEDGSPIPWFSYIEPDEFADRIDELHADAIRMTIKAERECENVRNVLRDVCSFADLDGVTIGGRVLRARIDEAINKTAPSPTEKLNGIARALTLQREAERQRDEIFGQLKLVEAERELYKKRADEAYIYPDAAPWTVEELAQQYRYLREEIAHTRELTAKIIDDRDRWKKTITDCAKDADRYRWLRDNYDVRTLIDAGDFTSLDAAIDAELSEADHAR